VHYLNNYFDGAEHLQLIITETSEVATAIVKFIHLKVWHVS
jgi:hypothetical protein